MTFWKYFEIYIGKHFESTRIADVWKFLFFLFACEEGEHKGEAIVFLLTENFTLDDWWSLKTMVMK